MKLQTVVAVLTTVAIASTLAADDPAAPATDDLQQVHRKLSSDCYNRCWGLIEKEDRLLLGNSDEAGAALSQARHHLGLVANEDEKGWLQADILKLDEMMAP